MEPDNMFSAVSEELARVEAGLQQVFESAGPEIRQVGSYIFSARGKKIRPALFLLVARLREQDLAPFIDGAVALELVHTASLLHDDVVDQSPTRRGRPAVHVRWSNRVAVLAGDFLLSRAFQLLLQYQSGPLLELMSTVVAEMAEGEIEQAFARCDSRTMEQLYFRWIGKKTASFFAGCCQAGCLITGGGEAEQRRWAEYGRNLGITFQLIDDLLDYTGDRGATGKPLFGDLGNRVYTLPLIHTLESSPNGFSLNEIIAGEQIDSAQLPRVALAVLSGDGTGYTFERAREYAGRAEAALEAFPDLARADRDIFERLIRQVLSRKT